MKRTHALSAVFAIAIASASRAQVDVPAPRVVPPAALVLEPGPTTLRAVVDGAAVALGRNIILDEMELQMMPANGVVTLGAAVTIDPVRGEETLAALLVQNHFVLTEIDGDRGLYEVIALRGPRQRLAMSRAPLRTMAEVLARPGLQMPVMVTIRLQHATATDAAKSVRRHLGAAARRSAPCTFAVTADPKQIVMTGLQADVAAALQIVRAADVPGAEVFTLAAGEHELPKLVAGVADFLQWTIRLDPAELRGLAPRFHLQQTLHLDRIGCEETIAALLASRGFALTVTEAASNRYEVVAMHGPNGKLALERAVSRTPTEVLARPTLQMPVRTALRLQHADALLAINALRPFFASLTLPGNLQIAAGEAPQEVALVGMQSDVATALRILMATDVASPDGK